uniref:Uncharacterized protein n=1 Tax=Leersia perrieri TaxID=77586 RepID=A0A0D9WJW4_9ORYZ
MADGGDNSAAESDDGGFTFAAADLIGGGVISGGRIGAVYPVFGRPRSPPAKEEEDGESETATVRVPLGQLLLEERASSSSSLEEEMKPDGDGDLDGVAAETYCVWTPGSPAVSPARCQKSGSTGSVLRWRQRLIGRSHSDGKEKFVFLSSNSSSDRSKGRKTTSGGGWRYYGRGGGGGGGNGGGGGRRPSFLPYKQDLVGLFANAGAFRRIYHPF